MDIINRLIKHNFIRIFFITKTHIYLDTIIYKDISK